VTQREIERGTRFRRIVSFIIILLLLLLSLFCLPLHALSSATSPASPLPLTPPHRTGASRIPVHVGQLMAAEEDAMRYVTSHTTSVDFKDAWQEKLVGK
jgi:hypothetical protein